MRRLLLVISGLVLIATGGVMLAARSESLVLRSVSAMVELFSDLRLDLRNPRLDVYAGTLSADEIHLLPASGEGPALVSLLDVSATLSRGGWGRGGLLESSLQAEALMIFVSDQGESAAPAPTQWLAYLDWLPGSLLLGQVHLITASANTWIFPLKNVNGARLKSGHYRASADADYGGEPLDIALEILALENARGMAQADARITFNAPLSGSKIEVKGELAGDSEAFQYDFALDAFYQDISEFLKGFEGGRDLAGTLQLNGRVIGDASGFVLSDAHFVLNNMPAYGFEAGGELSYNWDGSSKLDLAATGELASLDYLVTWLDVDVAGLGRAQSSIRLSGSLDQPVIETFRVSTGNDAGLTLSLSGNLKLYDAVPSETEQDNTVFVDIQGPSLKVLEKWLGDVPFDPGPWRASGRVTGDQHAVAVNQLVIEAGTPATAELRATGAIAHILLPAEGAREGVQATGIALDVLAQVEDSAGLGALLELELPPYQQLTARLQLAGDQDQLQISDGVVTISGSDLLIEAEKIHGVLHPMAAQKLSGLNAGIRLALSDTSALSQYSTLPAPVLGPVSVTAALSQAGDAFQLADIVGTIRSEDLDFELRGKIGDLAGPKKVSLQGKFTGLKTRQLLLTALPDFNYAGAIASVAGSFSVSDNREAWDIPALSITAGTVDTAVQVSANGEIRDLLGLPRAKIKANVEVRDTDLLQALSGLPLSPLAATVDLDSSAYGLIGYASSKIGQSEFQINSVVSFKDDAVQSVQLSLHTPHLYLQDLFSAPQSLALAPTDTAMAQGPGPLARLRQSPPTFSTDVAVSIGGISGDNTHIDSLAIRVTGIDHRYTLENFSAIYGNALAEIRGIVDLAAEPAAISLAGNAVALPLSAILTDVGVNTNVSGRLTLLGGVTLVGDSPAELLGNLNGSMAMALEDAVIEGAAYDLLATDLLAWIYSGALNDKSTFIDCTMAKFQFSQGVATTDSLYVESAKMIATGKAKFDLVQQQMDLRITPLSKSRTLQVPSEVRLKGAMSNPQAIVSPVNAMADAATAALTLIPDLTMKLFGINQSRSKQQRPCQAENPAS